MTKSNKIISFTNLESVNLQEFDVLYVRPPDLLCENSITLLTRPKELNILFKNAPGRVIAVIAPELKDEARQFKQTFILSPNPRITFSKIVQSFFKEKKNEFKISRYAKIKTRGLINQKVSIGDFCIIEGDINIERFTDIKHNCCIRGRVNIGKNTSISSGTIIGQKGFNYSWDKNGVPAEFPHLGKVSIGNNVRIGANCTIARGSLSDTIIADNVKMDDQVHIAHNVIIKKNSLLATSSKICGSVEIGKGVWISPNATIIDHVKIGDNAKVGIGAVVMKDVPANSTAIGNPARIIPNRENL